MLSEKLTKDVLILNFITDFAKKNEAVGRIKETLSLWKMTHFKLDRENVRLGFPKEKSENLCII